MAEETPEPAEAAPPTFDALPLSEDVRKAIDEMGYVHPTPVQRAVFEPAVRGADLVVQARTGTGKTAAFGLPLVEKLVNKKTAAVQALVLCPTRELALQVSAEVTALAKYREIKVAAVYGGAPIGAQMAKIRDGAQIVVGTPGRVLDHLERKTLDPSSIRIVILDESDEMLSMGFLPQIDKILTSLPEERQTLLFSATVPPDIMRLAERRLDKPELLTLSGDQIGALEIDHFVYLSHGDKLAELLQVLEIENPESAIVFCNTKDETKRVAAGLQNQGFEADWLNADLSQNEREHVMRRTREGKLRFLVATDVAARGIDISHLTHVICFDFPETAEQYVHRTGRTGRAGRTGTAVSLLGPSDIGNLYYLRLTYKLRPIERQLPTPRERQTRQEMDLLQTFDEAFAGRPTDARDLELARRLISHERAERIVAGLLRDHLGLRPTAAEEAAAARRSRAPTAMPSEDAPAAPEMRPPREPRPEARRQGRERGSRRGGRSDAAERRPRPREESDDLPRYTVEDTAPAGDGPPRRDDAGTDESAAAEVFVNLGRKDAVSEEDVLLALEGGGIERGSVTRVTIRNMHTFVAVPRDLQARVVDVLNGATLAGKPARAEPARSTAPRERRA